MRNKFNWISDVVATAVATTVLWAGAVTAQSSRGASSPVVNDRTSSGVVSDTPAPRRAAVPTPSASAAASTLPMPANARADDTAPEPRTTRHASRSDRN